jgi:hypothetical protein
MAKVSVLPGSDIAMDALKKEAARKPRPSAAKFLTWGVGALVLSALGLFWLVHEPAQRVILPSGYMLVLRDVVFAPDTKSVVLGPFWNPWLARLPAQRVPRWLRSEWSQANRSRHSVGGTNGFWIVEDLLPPAGSRPTGGPGSFHHEVVMDGEPFRSQPMGGVTDMDYVICQGDSYPRRAATFRVQIFTLENGVKGLLLGEFRIRNPHPMVSPVRTPEVLPFVRTNAGLECELLRVELAQAKPSDRLQEAGRLQLRLREQGSQATNWAVSSLLVGDPTGDRATWVRNLGWSNGVMRAGFTPLATEDPAWKLHLEFARVSAFPAGNQWTLTVTNLPAGQISERLAAGQFGGGAFEAVLAMPGWLELPAGTRLIESPLLWVKASGATEHFHLRLVALTDQRGRSLAWKRPTWGGDVYHWPLADEQALVDGSVQSVTATFSWEPKVAFEFFVLPTTTTNFADWLRRP